jgi:hypothetical protein
MAVVSVAAAGLATAAVEAAMALVTLASTVMVAATL